MQDLVEQKQIRIAQTLYLQLTGCTELPGHPLSSAGYVHGLIQST